MIDRGVLDPEFDFETFDWFNDGKDTAGWLTTRCGLPDLSEFDLQQAKSARTRMALAVPLEWFVSNEELGFGSDAGGMSERAQMEFPGAADLTPPHPIEPELTTEASSPLVFVGNDQDKLWHDTRTELNAWVVQLGSEAAANDAAVDGCSGRPRVVTLLFVGADCWVQAFRRLSESRPTELAQSAYDPLPTVWWKTSIPLSAALHGALLAAAEPLS